MVFASRVFILAEKLFDCVQEKDLEGVKEIKLRQALLWANASDEDLEEYASYKAKEFKISEEEALRLLRSVRSLHQRRFGIKK